MKAKANSLVYIAVPFYSRKGIVVYRKFGLDLGLDQLPIKGILWWPLRKERYNRFVVLGKQHSIPRQVIYFNE
jgi:hypothetical protein